MQIMLMGSLELGLIFAIMALGVYLTFRILNFPDLTVDGSFTLGGAMAAMMITQGYSPLLGTLSAALAGAVAGWFTGMLHTKGKINDLLAGILTMIALYSINLRVMGKPNIPLLREETLFTQIEGLFLSKTVVIPLFLVFIVFVIKLLVDWFLKTDIGTALRATGDNQRMIRSFGVHTDFTIIIGLSLSNALVGFSGALMAQYQGYADAGMGIGMIVVGLASVIIGEVVFGRPNIWRTTLAVVGGGILYRFVVGLSLYIGLEPSDMKLITSILVILALTMPRFASVLQKKNNSLVKAEGRGTHVTNSTSNESV
ncbi:ABC transporter permease [Microaerobacter geothermalis]|uniref:ABC transporter permease n=1 Tax=Microaerobacter geothermalis TaxID=674972 RepID=UPI001F1C58AC|nr:ABC transporter permease [Microaerobacter geothermalis]MCF6093660.1 ABC transporter permease [Microaerobacter geothermalis]